MLNNIERGAIGELVDYAKAINQETIVLSMDSITKAHTAVRSARPEDPIRPLSERVMAAYSTLPAGTKNEMGQGTEVVLHVITGHVGIRRPFDFLQRLVTTTSP